MEEILKLDPIMKVGGSVDLPGSKSTAFSGTVRRDNRIK